MYCVVLSTLGFEGRDADVQSLRSPRFASREGQAGTMALQYNAQYGKISGTPVATTGRAFRACCINGQLGWLPLALCGVDSTPDT